ncbi:MAG: NYN domain-containing protein [Pseudomonadota bacterium]
MPDRERPLLAVLIDADNVPAKFAEPILKEITAIGEPALRRVYGDWSSDRLKAWSEKILALGLVAHQQTAHSSGKNASDIGLVIDAMDMLHAGRFDGFVIVSSDSDFTSLANRLREDGIKVYGIGEAKAPLSLKSVCNRFIFIENLVETPKENGQNGGPAPKARPAKAEALILEAMGRIDQDDEWYHLAQLGQAVSAAHPDFDTRTYGKSKLSDLVAAIQSFETRRDGNRLLVRHLPRKSSKT